MGIFNKVRRILRGGKALPNEHGPAFIKRDDMGRWVDEKSEAKCPVDHSAFFTIEVVKAIANDNPACVCGQGKNCYCKAGDAKKDYAKAVTEKQKAASKSKPVVKSEVAPIIAEINKKASVTKKPVAKTTAKKDAIKKDIADTPVAKKTPAKNPATPTAKKPAPKKK